MAKISPPRTITPTQQLDAVPMQNPQVTEKHLAGGGVALTVPLRRNMITAALGRLTGQTLTKTYQLDANAASVWIACNGKSSVRDICHHIARQLNLPPEQAKQSTLLYIKTLAAKKLIGLSISTEHGPRRSR